MTATIGWLGVAIAFGLALARFAEGKAAALAEVEAAAKASKLAAPASSAPEIEAQPVQG